jgi:hypothetical protein
VAALRLIETEIARAGAARARRRRRISAALLLAAALGGISPATGLADPPPSPQAAGSQNQATDAIPWWARDRFDSVFLPGQAVSHYLLKRAPEPGTSFVYFPPVPPPLGSDLPLLAPFASGAPAPPELARFVNELFYPMLGARLAADDLPKALRAQLLAYSTAKVELQGELRLRIESLKDADPNARERQLAALAASQAPRIAEVRAAAERLRTDLRRTGLFGLPSGNADDAYISGGRLPPERDAPVVAGDLLLESEAMRGAAFFQDGLSTPQRALLRDAAIELWAETDPSQGAAKAHPGEPLLYFSPETARVPLPENLPPPLERRISEYTASKNRLKSELLNAVRSNETSGGARTEAFRKLAEAEAPSFAALDAMAEGIRRELAKLPDPSGPPAAPALPGDLTARISAYRTHKIELLRLLRGMLGDSVHSGETTQARRDAKAADPIASATEWMHDGTTSTGVQPSDLKVSAAEFERVQSTRLAELNRERAGIRESLSEYVRANDRPTDTKSVDDLLKDFEDARQRQELWDKYRDYQAAALMPGLSPEQRCILYDAAVEELALPLPAGESLR